MRIATCGLLAWVLAAFGSANLLTPAAAAAELRVEPLEEPAPAEGLAAEITETLSPSGFKVMSGPSRTVCEIWPCKEWAVQADFKPTNSELYPFEMGQLMGVIRYKRKGGDFRGQEIPAGVYTLRYALQPVDGNHVGTSDTRDFLLLVPAADETTAAPTPGEELFTQSAKAAQATHPAMLCLLATPAEPDSLPAMQHVESRELWALGIKNPTVGGGEQALSLVVVGKAAE